MEKTLNNHSSMIDIPAGGGAFKRYLNPFTSKAIYYSVLATSLSTFIFHSQAYAQSNNEKSVPQIIALNVTQNPLAKPQAILKDNISLDATHNGVIGSKDAPVDFSIEEKDKDKTTTTFKENTYLGSLAFNKTGYVEEDENETLSPTTIKFGKELSINEIKTIENTIIEIKDWNSLESVKNEITHWLENSQSNEKARAKGLRLVGEKDSALSIGKINNKNYIEIKADTLNIEEGIITNGTGATNIEFTKGEIKGENIGIPIKLSCNLTHCDLIPMYIKTQEGIISAKINNSGLADIKIILDGGGKITGDISLENNKKTIGFSSVNSPYVNDVSIASIFLGNGEMSGKINVEDNNLLFLTL
ncbi:hypothetical protein IP358_05110 [Helicobacter winghamensis ATCC BAA-430]|uniref:hypothetical protein n=4 Tax=Helicobacter winghamensis TaxID=157268 RepID=UPI0027A317BB